MTGLLDSRRIASLGARPAHFPADLREIADLIELCFFDTLDEAGRQMLQRARAMSGLGGLGWHTYRWMGNGDEMDWFHGFVWTDGGKIVGNVSLAPSHREPHTWAIANVSVHPTHRRRGISRDLTRLALDEIRRQGGHTAVLQVKAGNQAAMALYHGLGFREVTQRTLWSRQAALCPDIAGQTSPRGLTRPVAPHRRRVAGRIRIGAQGLSGGVGLALARERGVVPPVAGSARPATAGGRK